MLIQDSNVSLSLHKVDYLTYSNSAECEMRNAKKNLTCNLRNVPQVQFHKIHLFKFPHSAIRKVHLLTLESLGIRYYLS